jgi:hypothetical protein
MIIRTGEGSYEEGKNRTNEQGDDKCPDRHPGLPDFDNDNAEDEHSN